MSPRERFETCADCRKFPIRKLDAEGRALCPEYDQMRRWSDRANPCVLFMAPGASEELARKKIIEQLHHQENHKK